ncbi:hypothetical protein VCB98_01960 [Gammaproteobacteria bacterium AB-CW1]|uniref:Metallophosphoesterase n=1 Tax=Natronospira elongata TaxID=3110268 RepID=A0AAP6JH09_9GAMM|nr:hypothetical protein [Gammaproteobacteria bacterium AB-CW1]
MDRESPAFGRTLARLLILALFLSLAGCLASDSDDASDEEETLADGLLFTTQARLAPVQGEEALIDPPLRHGDPEAGEPAFVDRETEEGVESFPELGAVELGDGLARVQRDELGLGEPSDDRASVYFMLHTADVQVVDEKSPGLIPASKFAARPTTTPAHRSQNAYVPHAADAMIRAANRIQAEFRPFNLAVHAGDAIEGAQANELDWFLTLLNGGQFTPVSADTLNVDAPEGLDPEAPIDAEGLDGPWLAAVGNHDVLALGNFPIGALAFVNQPEQFPLFQSIFGQAGLSVPNLGPREERRDWLDESELLITPDEDLDLDQLLSWTRKAEAFADFFQDGGFNPQSIASDQQREQLDRCGFIDGHFDTNGQPSGHGFGGLNEPDPDGRCVGFHSHQPDDAPWLRVVTLDTAYIYGGDLGVIGRPQAPYDFDALEISEALSQAFSEGDEALTKPDTAQDLFQVPYLQGEALSDDFDDPTRDQVAFLEAELAAAADENQAVIIHSHHYNGSMTAVHEFRLFLEALICEGLSTAIGFRTGEPADCDPADGQLSTGNVGAPVRGAEDAGNRQALDLFAQIMEGSSDATFAELDQDTVNDGVATLNLLQSGAGDQVVLAFQLLFNLRSIMPDPVEPMAPEQLRTQLAQHPNVILHLAGHAHRHSITAVCVNGEMIAADEGDSCADRGADQADQGYYEIVSPGSVDRPMEWKLVELVDNGDDSLSVFTTAYGAAGDPFYDQAMRLALADILVDAASPRVDHPADINVELTVPLPPGVSTRLQDAERQEIISHQFDEL